MSLFTELAEYGDDIAFITPAERVSYVDVDSRCKKMATTLPDKRSLILINAEHTVDTLIALFTSIREGHVAMLVNPTIANDELDKIIEHFSPNVMVKNGIAVTVHNEELVADPNVALMLSTSGSTGSAKWVMLSVENLQANAASICAYLPIRQDDLTLGNLPLHYAYGLSVITSHILKGATVLLSSVSVIDKAFWQLFEEYPITSIAGVPYTYEMLVRLGFHKKNYSHLRYFTQAGGKLSTRLIDTLADFAATQSLAFYVMYGQTEATARMAYLSPEKINEKVSSIGQAIPGGELTLVNELNETITAPYMHGELCYRGQNVMLGYAQRRSDLAKLTNPEWLATGDIAYFDDAGDFYIVGRKKRFVKLWGQRFSLDAIESLLHENGINGFVLGVDNRIDIMTTQGQLDIAEGLRLRLAKQLGVHPSALRVHEMASLPMTANGKPDYQALSNYLTKKYSS
ncbi:AMP-binding protein [Aestuariibacter sp. AA17]|uniref:AMP-binding protein n=1 Tax=Fluctibacter corallii TaxID=2984329 RepID=A0ABT3AA36_9ALTE|nr:AMP-binding protein [Aestuariibacter sp. AA17]MCV2885455.1 AMP-binding protein [Aestuariibacter sp. AA17]